MLPLLLAGCRDDMHNQPRYKPLAGTDFFSDGRSARPVIDGTVARGHLRTDTARFTGKAGDQDVAMFPFPITRDDLARGQQRYRIFCTPCHGELGDGNGMIVKRGFKQPPTYHSARLKKIEIGHFFDVVTNGYGAMPSYASRVPVDDRWRIAAYIRALQLSQSSTVGDLPLDQRPQLDPPASARKEGGE